MLKHTENPSSEFGPQDVDVLVDLLEAINCKPERDGDQLISRCPVCTSRHKILTFSCREGESLKIACRSGCKPESVIEAGRKYLSKPLPDPRVLRCITILDLLKADIPPREFILTPWLRAKDIVLSMPIEESAKHFSLREWPVRWLQAGPF